MKPRINRCHHLNSHLRKASISEGVSYQNSHPMYVNAKITIMQIFVWSLRSRLSNYNYCVAGKDRNRNGGGACTFILNDVAYCIKNDISADQDEILWLELHLPKTKAIIIWTSYRPPKQNKFLEEFENNLRNLR